MKDERYSAKNTVSTRPASGPRELRHTQKENQQKNESEKGTKNNPEDSSTSETRDERPFEFEVRGPDMRWMTERDRGRGGGMEGFEPRGEEGNEVAGEEMRRVL